MTGSQILGILGLWLMGMAIFWFLVMRNNERFDWRKPDDLLALAFFGGLTALLIFLLESFLQEPALLM